MAVLVCVRPCRSRQVSVQVVAALMGELVSPPMTDCIAFHASPFVADTLHDATLVEDQFTLVVSPERTSDETAVM